MGRFVHTEWNPHYSYNIVFLTIIALLHKMVSLELDGLQVAFQVSAVYPELPGRLQVYIRLRTLSHKLLTGLMTHNSMIEDQLPHLELLLNPQLFGNFLVRTVLLGAACSYILTLIDAVLEEAVIVLVRNADGLRSLQNHGGVTLRRTGGSRSGGLLRWMFLPSFGSFW
jgi:hypothetical protein